VRVHVYNVTWWMAETAAARSKQRRSNAAASYFGLPNQGGMMHGRPSMSMRLVAHVSHNHAHPPTKEVWRKC
jgi:hypothetical protein